MRRRAHSVTIRCVDNTEILLSCRQTDGHVLQRLISCWKTASAQSRPLLVRDLSEYQPKLGTECWSPVTDDRVPPYRGAVLVRKHTSSIDTVVAA